MGKKKQSYLHAVWNGSVLDAYHDLWSKWCQSVDKSQASNHCRVAVGVLPQPWCSTKGLRNNQWRALNTKKCSRWDNFKPTKHKNMNTSFRWHESYYLELMYIYIYLVPHVLSKFPCGLFVRKKGSNLEGSIRVKIRPFFLKRFDWFVSICDLDIYNINMFLLVLDSSASFNNMLLSINMFLSKKFHQISPTFTESISEPIIFDSMKQQHGAILWHLRRNRATLRGPLS